MRILVPLDGTAVAERALHPAAQLMHLHDPADRLIVIHVASMDDWQGDSAALVPDWLEGAIERANLADLPVTTRLRPGDPVAEISAAAHEEQATLIVMACSERMWQRHLLATCVADQVLRSTHLPVLMVRPDGETFPDIGRFEPLTILVPLDGLSLAEAVIEPAAEIALHLHGAIRLMRVLPQQIGPASHQTAALLAQEALEYLTDLHGRLEARGITTHRSLAWGDPAEEIGAEVQRHNIDLIALATHARHGLEVVSYGSVYREVARRARLPLLVVHPAPAMKHNAPRPIQSRS
jgi:nucleotide-binding universal stress UspA family protein